MSDANLERVLAETISRALKSHGHILLVRGGEEGLLRELASLTRAAVSVLDRIRAGEVHGEVTSTFGDERVDELMEELVQDIGSTLMDSDHVEDVFAEDHVIRRDIFRALRDKLIELSKVGSETETDEGPVSVRLDTLGYVAATASRRADEPTLRAALERAAQSADGSLQSFDAGARLASFRLPDEDPDRRLEIEEAVADELADLVDLGIVELPSIVKVVPVSIPRTLHAVLRPGVETAANRTLRTSGCAVDWDFVGDEALRVRFIPTSEQDGQAVEGVTARFHHEVERLLERVLSVDSPMDFDRTDLSWASAPRAPRRSDVEPAGAISAEPAPPTQRAVDAEPAPVTKKTGTVERAAPASKKPAAKQVAPKKAAPASKKPAAKKPAAKKPAAKKPAAKKAAPAPKKPAAKKPAAKQVAPKKAAPASKKPAAKKAAPASKKPAAKKAAPASKKPAAKKAAPASKKNGVSKKTPSAGPTTKKPVGAKSSRRPKRS